MKQIILTDKNKVRQPHIIPDFYVRKFANNERIFVYTKGRPVRTVAVKPGRRVKECRERDYFEYPVDRNWSENQIENWLSVIESQASKVYDPIQNNHQLSQEEASIWATFVASLFLRTRKIRLQLGPAALSRIRPVDGDKDIRDYQYELLKQGRLIPYERLKKASENVWDEMAANPAFGHLIALNKSTPNIARSILSKAWTVCEACEGSRFLTSDAPVITMKIVGGNQAYPGHGFGLIDVAVFLPISPTQIFIASPKDILWERVQDSNNVDLLNKAIANFADKSVYSNVCLDTIQTLVNREIGLTKFGDDAFKMTNPNISRV